MTFYRFLLCITSFVALRAGKPTLRMLQNRITGFSRAFYIKYFMRAASNNNMVIFETF